MNDWKYIRTIDDLPIEDGEYIVMFCDTDEAKQFGGTDFVTVAEFEYDQKLWRIGENWYLNPLVALDCNNKSIQRISHWMEMPNIPKE